MEKESKGRGRPATGRRWTHRLNLHLDADTYKWISRSKPQNISTTKYINDIIRKEAGIL